MKAVDGEIRKTVNKKYFSTRPHDKSIWNQWTLLVQIIYLWFSHLHLSIIDIASSSMRDTLKNSSWGFDSRSNARNGSFEIFLPNSFHTTFSYSFPYQGGLPPFFIELGKKSLKLLLHHRKKKKRNKTKQKHDVLLIHPNFKFCKSNKKLPAISAILADLDILFESLMK